MNRSLIVLLAAVAILLTGAAPPQPPVAAGTAARDLAKIHSLMGRPRTASREEFLKKLTESRRQVLTILAGMESSYPKAKELHQARLQGVMAAVQLGRLNQDATMEVKALKIAARLLASEAPGQVKLNADAYVVMLKLRPIKPPASQPASQPAGAREKAVRDMVARYAKGELAVDALMIARSLAEMSEMDALVEQLVNQIIKEHPSHRAAVQLRQQRAQQKVGKPFTATLTTLDGKKLNLPADLKGKVVVIDFWAVWCGPCVAEIPHMKELYAKYKDRGVEFVGISLDRDKAKLAAFVKQRQMGWVHTFSGKGWDDPTVRAYGVRGIPSIWVVGKDGKVVSDKARGQLARVLDKALAAPAATKPVAVGKAPK